MTSFSSNEIPNWSNSLTPHKICDAFTKEAGKPEAQAWLNTYGPPFNRSTIGGP
jgi:acid phosphatase